jgi:ribosome maturation factor RimP
VSGRGEKLRELLQPTVEALGFELWGVEHLAQGRHSLLRVYIDGADGVGVDDCAVVSEQVSGVLDVEDPITGEYTLEVSSPGLDRPLFTLAQYGRYAGEIIDLRLRLPYEGRRRFRGRLTGVEGEDVVVQVDDHEYLLPFGAIDKARVELPAEAGRPRHEAG